MILEKLCELARREELLKNPDYEPKPVAWIIAVSEAGKFLDVVPTAGAEAPGKKPRAKVFQVPRRQPGRTSAPIADFLVDKSEYVLAVEPDGKRSPADLRRRLDLFRRSIREAREATDSPALGAVESFLGSDDERAYAVERISSAGYASNDLFAFQYRGQLVHESPEVQAHFSLSRRATAKAGAQCLICGKRGPLARNHPLVKIPGGTTSGIALVSFNSDAFESYGLSRNENAPVCRDCADAYTTALNRLLSDRYPDPQHPGETLPRRWVRLAPDTTAVYWTDEDTPILDLLMDLDAPRIESVAELLLSPRKGRTPPSVSNRFYCLIFSGGQGRAVLRGMHTGTVAQVEESIRAYFESIRIGSDQPSALHRLLESIVLQGKLQNLPRSLETDVFLAIVFGRDFPLTLLARAVGRCRAEQKVTRERAALLRAYLIRNLKREVNVGLDKENTRVGYRLGRLMAVLERVQGAAQNNPNKTIVDRYYSAASTRPAIVFPRLMALATHHLAKLTGGLEGYYQNTLGEVMDGIALFPPTLSLEEQGLFALGYYHQRFFKKAESEQENEGEKSGEDGEAA